MATKRSKEAAGKPAKAAYPKKTAKKSKRAPKVTAKPKAPVRILGVTPDKVESHSDS